MKIIEKHAPLKKRRIRKQESPWMTSDIIDLIRKRNLKRNTQSNLRWKTIGMNIDVYEIRSQ